MNSMDKQANAQLPGKEKVRATHKYSGIPYPDTKSRVKKILFEDIFEAYKKMFKYGLSFMTSNFV